MDASMLGSFKGEYLMKFITLCFAVIVSALVAPAHATEADQPSFSSVVLWAYGFDEKAAAEIERDAIKTYEKKGIHAIAMVDLIPDPGQRNIVLVMKKLHATKAEAVLQIANRGIYSRSSKWGHNTHAKGNIARTIQLGNSEPNIATVAGNREGWSVTTSGNGHSITKPSATYTVWLMDARTMRTVWTERIKATGQKTSSFDYIAEKALRKASRKAIKLQYFAPDLDPTNDRPFEEQPQDPAQPDLTLPPETRHSDGYLPQGNLGGNDLRL